MLKEWISKRVSQPNAMTAMQSGLCARFEDWLLPISIDCLTGTDPTYTDAFQSIKEEVGKISGADVARVAKLSEELLKSTSKDLRVATYYGWARMKQLGLLGFIEGLELLAALLTTFGSAVYPSRESVRKNSIVWFVSPKFTDTFHDSFPIDASMRERLVIALAVLVECNQSLFVSSNPPELDNVLRLFDQTPAAPVTTTPTPEPISAPPCAIAEKRTTVTRIPLTSLSDIGDPIRRIAAFLREKPEGYLSAGRLIRSVRWDTIHMIPPADMQRRTRLVPPRMELKNHLHRLVQNQQWQEVIDNVELAFMENANHFWLDLQRYAITAMQKHSAQFAAWADIMLTDVGLILDRLSGLEHLCFSNGMPFADEDTLLWIRTCATIHHMEPDALVSAYVPKSTDPINWQEMEQQARHMAQEEDLETAINWLQTLPTQGALKQQILLRYTQARVAEHLGQRDAALCLFQGLNQQEPHLRLCDWEMELWFDIKAHLFALLQYKLQRKEGDKMALLTQMEQVQRDMMQLNPARTIRLSAS